MSINMSMKYIKLTSILTALVLTISTEVFSVVDGSRLTLRAYNDIMDTRQTLISTISPSSHSHCYINEVLHSGRV